jgi:hypothetical protein
MTLMVAKVTADVASIILTVSFPVEPAAITAPTSVIPEIAFEPDISGVCSVAGTFDIISKPRKIDNMRINAKKMSVVGSITFPLSVNLFGDGIVKAAVNID